jgi:hypothetical protein
MLGASWWWGKAVYAIDIGPSDMTDVHSVPLFRWVNSYTRLKCPMSPCLVKTFCYTAELQITFLLQREFTPWFWNQRVFCCLQKVDRASCKFTDHIFPQKHQEMWLPSEQNLLLYCSLFNFWNCFVFSAKKYSWQVCLTIRMVAQSAYCLPHKCNPCPVK